MASIITSFKSVGKTKALRNDDGYESIKLDEHNPATGLPMIVDVGVIPMVTVDMNRTANAMLGRM
jgi:hypothetical protein